MSGCTSPTGTPAPQQVGQRVFNVDLDGTPVLDNYDIVADVGDQTGTMKDWVVTSPGQITIQFSHVVENPLINGIEIVKTGQRPPPPPSDQLSRRYFDGTTATADTIVPSGGIAWGSVRGAVQVDNQVFYGTSSGMLYRTTFDGTSWGTATAIDPYHDPAWCNVYTGSGNTYCGASPTFYSELPNVTALGYQAGKLYYALYGQTGLYYRLFSVESGIVSAESFQVPNATLPAGASALLFSGGKLYIGDRSTGNLLSVGFTDAGFSGTPTAISGPGIDGKDWRARAVFLGAGPGAHHEQAPHGQPQGHLHRADLLPGPHRNH